MGRSVNYVALSSVFELTSDRCGPAGLSAIPLMLHGCKTQIEDLYVAALKAIVRHNFRHHLALHSGMDCTNQIQALWSGFSRVIRKKNLGF